MSLIIRSVICATVLAVLSCDKYTNEEMAVQRFHEANTCFDKGEYKNCIDLYEFVISKRPLIRDAYRNLAQCYLKLSDPKAAIKTYKKLLKHCNPEDTETWWDLAKLEEKEGLKKDAIKTLVRLLEITPHDSRITAEIERLKRGDK